MIDRICLAAEAVLRYGRETRTCVMRGRRINRNEPTLYFGSHLGAQRVRDLPPQIVLVSRGLVSSRNYERGIGGAVVMLEHGCGLLRAVGHGSPRTRSSIW